MKCCPHLRNSISYDGIQKFPSATCIPSISSRRGFGNDFDSSHFTNFIFFRLNTKQLIAQHIPLFNAMFSGRQPPQDVKVFRRFWEWHGPHLHSFACGWVEPSHQQQRFIEFWRRESFKIILPSWLQIAPISLGASGCLHRKILQGCCDTNHGQPPGRFSCHCWSSVPSWTRCWVQVLSLHELYITDDEYPTV